MFLKELVDDSKSNPMLNKLKENSRTAYYYGLERVNKLVTDPRADIRDPSLVYGSGPGSTVDAGAVSVLVSGYLGAK